MGHFKLFSLLSILSLALLLGGCVSNSVQTSGGGPTTTVYMVGYTAAASGNASAEEWRLASGSSTSVATTLSMPSGMTGSAANAITVSGSDVYVAGVAWNGANIDAAVYWTNGAATALPLPIGMTAASASGIAVSGSDVYVTGYAWTSGSANFSAVYWLNGTATTLPLSSGYTQYLANGIAVSDGDAYVAGEAIYTQNTPVYWVNGTATFLPIPSGMAGAEAEAIEVSGSDVYVAGFSFAPGIGPTVYAPTVYWVNGTAMALPPPSGMTNFEVTTSASPPSAITVSGSNVYVAGVVSNNTNANAAYWLNGTAAALPTPSGLANSWATGIAVLGSNVYVTGDAWNNPGNDTAVYWLNGTLETLPLPSGTAYSKANAITVSTQ